MSQSAFIFGEMLDVSNCDQEPIQIPGAIQSHGILFVVSEVGDIQQVSDNVGDALGYPSPELLNQPIKKIFPQSDYQLFISNIQNLKTKCNLQLKVITKKGKEQPYEIIIHRNDEGLLIVELESNGSEVYLSDLSFFNEVLYKWQESTSVKELSELAVKAMREITGFDRVMMYRFDDEWNGEVIAEDLKKGQGSFLKLHFPASDIPQQARELYLRNIIRIIPDVDYELVPLVPVKNPTTKRDLDLSHSTLRSVSPLHIEYLNNMGVKASMSISIIVDGRLWGLIACHHPTPFYVPYKKRQACEFMGRTLSIILKEKEIQENSVRKAAMQEVQVKLVEQMSKASNFVDGLYKGDVSVMDLVNCGGCAICLEGNVVTLGETPTEEQIIHLTSWLSRNVKEDVFFTNSLIEYYKEAGSFTNLGAGVIAASISKVQQEYIIWFRPELIHEVNWAGRPDKAVVKEEDRGGLSPRKSFAVWTQTVKQKCYKWSALERQAVHDLRGVVVDIVMRLSGELKLKADILCRLNKELEKSNDELDSFAYIASHDLKEPLRGIQNYVEFLLEDYKNKIDPEGMQKLSTLKRLSNRMEELIDSLLYFSRVGRVELHKKMVDMNEVLNKAVICLEDRLADKKVDVKVPEPLPEAFCDAKQMVEVFMNLISNGLKFNDKENITIEVGAIRNTGIDEGNEIEGNEDLVFYVKDNGIGIEKRHHEVIFNIFRRLHPRDRYEGGTGAGLTITKKIIERHGGEIWVESEKNEGSTFYFTV